MSEILLSRDADYLICLIYKYYLDLHDNGIPKSQAKLLGSSENINNNIIPDGHLMMLMILAENSIELHY